MSFARNFAAGQQIARGLIDTYDAARERREMQEVLDARPEEGQGYTAEDGRMLQGLATARDADGNLAYQLDPRSDGSYGLRVRGADGSYTPVDGPGIQPGQYTEFLGQRRAGTMTPDQVENARDLGLAQVRMRRDPVAGMQMRRAAKQEAREDTGFGWEEQAQPLRQRTAELQVSGAERAERRGLREDDVLALEDSVAQMPREKLEELAGQLRAGEDGTANFPVMYVGTTKEGYQFVTTDPTNGRATGKTFTLNEAQMREMATAAVLSTAGYGRESLERMRSVNKEIADHFKSWNAALDATTKSQNDAVHKGHTARMQEGQLGVSWFNARSADKARREQGARAAERMGLDRMGAARYFEGDDGQMYAAVPTMGKGGLSFQTVPVNPEGIKLKAPGRVADAKPAKVPEEGEKYMVDGRVMVTDGDGGYIDPDGVPPRLRTQALLQAGIPESAVADLPWNQDGTAVGFAGKRYEVGRPEDMKALKKEITRLRTNTLAVEEDARRDYHLGNNPRRGWGPALTYPKDSRITGKERPAIDAPRAEWDAYLRQRRANY